MKKLFISRTQLPSLESYNKYLKRIWKANWLTNNGELVQGLEGKLAKRFGVKHVVCVSSGTSAILLTLRAMDIKKELFVSPYSFIATVSAPLFLGIKLRFVDIDEEYQEPALITHLYGAPYVKDVKPVIYDASHAFTTMYEGKSILTYGDVSIISFNAVKIFQTGEGGAVVTNNDEIAEKIRWMRNFGFKDRYSFQGIGINCKMSEFHAAMGLASLPLVNRIRKRFNQLIRRYNKAFGYDYKQLTYYPLYYETEKDVKWAIEVFEKHSIYPRRYFYPPLNKVFGGKSCPVAEALSKRVLCLPLYYSLTDKEQNKIIQIAKETR